VGTEPGQFTSTATLDTKGVQTGPIDVKMNVTDVRGLTGSCALSITVNPPPQATVVTETLIGECTFTDPKKATRVNNECKATLDETAMRLQREPNGKVIVLGCAEATEQAQGPLDAMRAVNAKYYLTSGEGQQKLDPSSVEARQGCTEGAKAKLFFVPAGGTFSMEQSTTVVDESKVKPQGRKAAAPVHKKKKAKKAAPAAPAAPAEPAAPANPQ
jgi:hypothetical protein